MLQFFILATHVTNKKYKGNIIKFKFFIAFHSFQDCGGCLSSFEIPYIFLLTLLPPQISNLKKAALEGCKITCAMSLSKEINV